MNQKVQDALEISNLNVTAASNALLRDVSVSVAGGKITVLVGGSGAGKSVLLRLLSGILPRQQSPVHWEGQITLGGTPLGAHSQGRTGIVFQQFALFDELTPTANIQFAIDHRADRSKPPRHSASEWLELLGVPASPPVAALSGGQKQRLAIARTLAADPQIILYDEPTSGLDAATGRRVAELIRETQSRFGRTSLVVTHDYAGLLKIADEVLLLDSKSKTITRVPPEQWDEIPERMQAVALPTSADRIDSANPRPNTRGIARRVIDNLGGRCLDTAGRFFGATGGTLVAAARLPFDALPIVPRPKWAARFLLHFLALVGGPTGCVYLLIAGLIVGFTTTYFTLRFLPFRLYTQPLLIDELLAAIGFALYRILVPVLATVLIAARCGAAVAADVGVKQYGGQIDALKTFGIRSTAYLLVPIMGAFLIATPILEWLAFTASHWISRMTFVVCYPEIGIHFWNQHFFRGITLAPDALGNAAWGSSLPVVGWFLLGKGWGWVLLKNTLCGFGTAGIAYHQGLTPKQSASDVSHCITATVLWATLYVLVVHFVIALLEF
ncbi:ABC-type transporter Mla maintaining outer membrane lipid asymmetry ATPase subunit MlaF/ABC-type transporter Mla maintaining outer membrane lipid asymmetry permease subunit MlaE [Rhodopirellula rubra]|uniref:ABC-type transporter Mla maintaining outer membrane lipid asymmetry ATPase subunit MlaF/ABC-type transporter Mla maintaining outer membrane lipid asymmetry permease subunit MlaE n=1 Tax=Aporhodopirellula rubra TaxID=980271 RepID=A0A7W5H8G8_9BACT|nr:ATP-binding cassette domain-containing protein [Aporhodopirellula rubra]MBB3209453.1 ABC-type transporter Mla maintaining outer membrane lipid asymmetry ATPase subunit MlaF/ABC-type transporter Mla maintaining outer membrane lipid asymmetry permease subunit MlaE [Aporhodopirellula rubra]